MTRKQIEAKFAATLNTTIGVAIEVTNRSEREWTVYGSAQDVAKAAQWLQANCRMRLDSIAHDDELDESFAYLTAA